jgi:hypothetical protein
MPSVTGFAGGCQCGAVRYVLRRESIAVYACHCRECQKQSASAFGLSLPFARDELELTGELASWRRPTDSGSFTTCYFCPRCGGRLFHVSDRNTDRGSLKAGTLDDTSDLEPRFHIWTRSKQPWVQLPADIPQFEEQSVDLDLMRELMR